MQNLLALLFLTAISTLAFAAPISSDNERLEDILAALVVASKPGRAMAGIEQQSPHQTNRGLLLTVLNSIKVRSLSTASCRELKKLCSSSIYPVLFNNLSSSHKMKLGLELTAWHCTTFIGAYCRK